MDKINTTTPISQFELIDKDGIIINIPLAEKEATERWKPNPTWWDIEKIYNEDTIEGYDRKAVLLITGGVEEEDIGKYINKTSGNYIGAIKTSDGKFYDGTQFTVSGGIMHTWDLTKDKPCIVNGTQLYTTRYVIVYSNNSESNSSSVYVSFQNNVLSVYGKIIHKPVNISSSIFQNQKSIVSIVLLDDNEFTNPLMFSGCSALRYAYPVNTSTSTSIQTYYQGCSALTRAEAFDSSNSENLQYVFKGCSALEYAPCLNTSKCKYFYGMFEECSSLLTTAQYDFNSVVTTSRMFYNCSALRAVQPANSSICTTFSNTFYGCSSLQKIDNWDTSSGIYFEAMFSGCSSLKLATGLNTANGTNLKNMFYNCKAVKTIETIDLINATDVSGLFSSCSDLENLTVKNIKLSLQISLGKLTLKSLLNAIKELHDNSSGSSTLTLTVGSANLTKLANVYVKLIDVTDEMRAEDEYIDNKLPFEVCESTDEGAMLITEYVTSKNWQLA